MADKFELLLAVIRKHDSLSVAFSGGVDSTFLAAAAHQALGDSLNLITVSSQFQSEREMTGAKNTAKKLGILHVSVKVDILENRKVLKNSRERCYFCKKAIFSQIKKASERMGVKQAAHGATLDDLHQYRPGLKAARELQYLSPLVEAGFTKEDVRQYSKKMGLETWNMPPQSCLATRIPYGQEISLESLQMVEKAENLLYELGFDNFRIRLNGKDARIELGGASMVKMVQEGLRKGVVRKMRNLGFQYVSLDLEGYMEGSMDRF